MTAQNIQTEDEPYYAAQRPPVVVQILSIIFYTAFAIPVSLTAMDQFGFIGLALAAFLAWQWVRIPALGGLTAPADAARILAPTVAPAPKTSGNASFDAYRNELLGRLEDEQHNFEGFVDRLRAAKDRTEFDRFMSERENSLRDAAGTRREQGFDAAATA